MTPRDGGRKDESMKVVYLTIECRIGYRRTYGIAAVDAEDGEKIVLGAVVDVSGNREKVDRLADHCNRVGLEVEKLMEKVEEYIDNYDFEE